ncbi:MAG TPA: hypothetical protein PK264_08050 [Hyphomicrobiaceae bacterium]|nr:hypothetical protein [Hyphomicrobiaceae bacterium]
MPLQNRVLPTGEIVASPARGLMMGNRGGRFHRADRTLGPRRWASRAWIACRLNFKGRHRPAMMMANSYTELFFLDEATALAAGHRPCFECRRADADCFARLWAGLRGGKERASADEMDRALHAERLAGPSGPDRWRALRDVPDGTIVEQDGPCLVLAGMLLPWAITGYRPPLSGRPAAVRLITPPAIVAVISAGYPPMVHPSAHPAAASMAVRSTLD